MFTNTIYRIIESKSSKFPVGKYVKAYFGWRTHTIASENFTGVLGQPGPRILPDYGGHPLSLALGILGMPG